MLQELRVLFEKRGRAALLSHLDLMHVLQRSFSRAGVRCAYSQGFNPHMQLTLPVPLPLGHEGLSELMEVRLEAGTDAASLPGLINPFLPEGIMLKEAFTPVLKPAEMATADYFAEADFGGFDPVQALDYLKSDSIEVFKKTKRGEGVANIASDVHAATFEQGGLALVLTSSQSANLNPVFVIKALENRFGVQISPCKYIRRAILSAQGQVFR